MREQEAPGFQTTIDTFNNPRAARQRKGLITSSKSTIIGDVLPYNRADLGARVINVKDLAGVVSLVGSSCMACERLNPVHICNSSSTQVVWSDPQLRNRKVVETALVLLLVFVVEEKASSFRNPHSSFGATVGATYLPRTTSNFDQHGLRSVASRTLRHHAIARTVRHPFCWTHLVRSITKAYTPLDSLTLS